MLLIISSAVLVSVGLLLWLVGALVTTAGEKRWERKDLGNVDVNDPDMQEAIYNALNQKLTVEEIESCLEKERKDQ